MAVLWGTMWCMVALSVLYLLVVVKGPSIWDRLLAINLIAVKVTIIIILFASIYESAFLLDAAIIYTLSGFIGTIFIALFFSKKEKKQKQDEKKEGKSIWRVY
ncbi:MAG: monovalent cation/H+ antiporter complex subunit F [Oscillospiraceae bacterium]|nr:monovalent cation/H+ antiporter complex subunit F [Oscillospiraceae bacterium]